VPLRQNPRRPDQFPGRLVLSELCIRCRMGAHLARREPTRHQMEAMACRRATAPQCLLFCRRGRVEFPELRDGTPRIDVSIQIDPSVLGGDAADFLNGGGFRDNNGGTSDGAASEVDEVPDLGMPVLCGVFAHGRNADAILEFDTTQYDWSEQSQWSSLDCVVLLGHLIQMGVVRVPNRAVPTRTSVEPSRMAASKSWDMPMDKTAKAQPSLIWS
jgi:hypothetical protein